MKKKLIVIAGVLIATQVLSGCYFLRELNWSEDRPKAGESTKGTIGLMPSGEDGESYFLLAVVGKGEGITPKTPKFDTKDVVGQEQKMVEDEALFDLFEENCDFFVPVARGGGVPGGFWRTEDPVTSNKLKFTDAKMKMKTDSEGGGFVGLVLTGEWTDDGDGVPEDPDTTDDAIMCTGESTTSVITKGSVPTALR